MSTEPRLEDDPLVAEVRGMVRSGFGPVDDSTGVVLDTFRKLLVVIDGERASLALVRTRAEEAESRVTELEEVLEVRSVSHLAEIERTQERCNQEAAVHRHEAQQAVQQAAELRGEVRDLRARVAQLEAEAAAAGKQAARLAADALRAEREAEGGRLIADGWRLVAEARQDTPRRWERTP